MTDGLEARSAVARTNPRLYSSSAIVGQVGPLVGWFDVAKVKMWPSHGYKSAGGFSFPRNELVDLHNWISHSAPRGPSLV